MKQEQTIDSPTIQQKIDERISTLNRTIDESHNLPSTLSTEDIDMDSSDVNEMGLTQEEIRMNALATRKRPRVESSPLPLSAPSPMAPILERPDCALEIDGRPILKFEQVTPGPPSNARKSMSRPLKEDESERIDSKAILASARDASVPASPMAPTPDVPSPMYRDPSFSPSPSEPPAVIRPTKKPKTKKPKPKAKPSTEIGISAPSSSVNTIPTTTTAKPKKKTNKSKSTGTSIGIGVPSSSTSGTAITIGAPGKTQENNEDDDDDDEMSTGRRGGKKRKGPKIYDYRLPENLRTLDDVKEDPADIDALEKPMKNFTKDIDGVVSKNFKEMETIRYEALRKLERVAKMSLEEIAAMKKKDEEEAVEAAKKKKIAKQKEDERRRKEADGHVLAES